MRLRTITSLVVYDPKKKYIVAGFRTKKDLERNYPDGIPFIFVVVKMKGHYIRRHRGYSGRDRGPSGS